MKTKTVRVDRLANGDIVLNDEFMGKHSISDIMSNMIALEVLHVQKSDIKPFYYIYFDSDFTMLRDSDVVEVITERLAP